MQFGVLVRGLFWWTGVTGTSLRDAAWGAGAGAVLRGLARARCVFARSTSRCWGACSLGILVQVLFWGVA